MNPLASTTVTGTVGELLVQLRLLQFGVQAAPPIKDSGNDLIALRHPTFRTIQVKTTTGDVYSTRRLPNRYDILAVVYLAVEDTKYDLERSRIFLIPKSDVPKAHRRISKIGDFEMSQDRIDRLFD